MTYLLDTNICIHFFRGMFNLAVFKSLMQRLGILGFVEWAKDNQIFE